MEGGFMTNQELNRRFAELCKHEWTIYNSKVSPILLACKYCAEIKEATNTELNKIIAPSC
jgi:hypothetical protein